MPIEIKRFKCLHCKRNYSKMSDAKKHEQNCIYNPKTNSCANCLNKKGKAYTYKDEYGCTVHRSHDFCRKYKAFLIQKDSVKDFFEEYETIRLTRNCPYFINMHDKKKRGNK
jgi:hypothetical protein